MKARYKYKYSMLAIESSQTAKSSEILDDLTDPGIPESKIIISDINGNKKFEYIPDVPDFYNGNEILQVGDDLYITYYWNSVTTAQNSRLLILKDLEVKNGTFKFSRQIVMDLQINAIHAMVSDGKYVYFSSRSSDVIGKLDSTDPENTYVTQPLTPLNSYSGDTFFVTKDYIFFGGYAALSPYRGRMIAVPSSLNTSEAIIMREFTSQSGYPFVYGDSKYVYYVEQDFASDTQKTLYKASLDNITQDQQLVINLPNLADIHSMVSDGIHLYLSTGRNPYLIKVHIETWTLVDIITIVEAQVPDPVDEGFYGSPETGFITDDIAYIKGKLFLPSELAVNKMLVYDAETLTFLNSYDSVKDIYGVIPFRKKYCLE